jgi:hypothetical protein
MQSNVDIVVINGFKMEKEKQEKIANSFSENYAEKDLNLILSISDFRKIEKGIYACNMEDKWNIFTLNNHIYWSRSWTDFCIFKIDFLVNGNNVDLKKFKVTRNQDEYKGTNIDEDITLFQKMLIYYLKTN